MENIPQNAAGIRTEPPFRDTQFTKIAVGRERSPTYVGANTY